MKNMIIAGVVGLLFMVGGFFVGGKLAPKPPAPTPKPVVVTPPADPTIPPTTGTVTMDAMRKASESMMNLNAALREREQKVTEQER